MTKNEATALLMEFTKWVSEIPDDSPLLDLETQEEAVAAFLLQRDLVAWPTVS